jgi:hypothetical protein
VHEWRPLLHLVLHVAVPAAVAWFGYPKQRVRAFAWMLAGWLIDVDHLLADPVYAPGRCSLGFHPLHTAPAVLAYVLMLLPRRTRLLAMGLLIHVGLDGLDCLAIHAGG